MDDQPPAPPVSPPEPPPKPRDSGLTIAGRAVLGFLAYVLVGWISLSLRFRSVGPVVLLVIIALGLAVAGKWRGFALGVFLGVGLTLLLVGLCLASFRI